MLRKRKEVDDDEPGSEENNRPLGRDWKLFVDQV